jgi:serine/threonine-protein kinase
MLGKNADAAREDLAEAGLRTGRVSEDYSESVAAGLVLSQAPSADEQLRRNAAVDFVVSRGPRPINVPSVAGRTEAEARRILSAAGLTAEVVDERVFDAAVPAGSVVRQDPAQGQLQRGGTVTLTLSQGPRMVEVPDLTGVQLDEARRRLEELGFEVRVNRIFGGIFGTVRSREPAGASLPEGSVITLNVV